MVSTERNNRQTIDAEKCTSAVSLGFIFNYWDMWWDRPMTNGKEPVQDIISTANSFKQDSNTLKAHKTGTLHLSELIQIASYYISRETLTLLYFWWILCVCLVRSGTMLEGYSPIIQALLGTLFTWGLTAAGAALVFVFSSHQVKNISTLTCTSFKKCLTYWTVCRNKV